MRAEIQNTIKMIPVLFMTLFPHARSDSSSDGDTNGISHLEKFRQQDHISPFGAFAPKMMEPPVGK